MHCTKGTTAQPKKDKFLSHFSSLLTIYLLFKCRFVADNGDFPQYLHPACPNTHGFMDSFLFLFYFIHYNYDMILRSQYNFIAKCQYTHCTRNVLWCQVHSSRIDSNHKTFNYNSK